MLARELRISRPHLSRDYDDGGVVANVCDIPVDVAARIVDACNQTGRPFSNVDEIFVLADLPMAAWDRIRDRAVLLT